MFNNEHDSYKLPGMFNQQNINNIPSFVTALDLSNKYIVDNELYNVNFPQHISYINLNNNYVSVLRGDHFKHVLVLEMNNCNVREIVSYPPKAEFVCLKNNRLSKIPPVPSHIKIIKLKSNLLTEKPKKNSIDTIIDDPLNIYNSDNQTPPIVRQLHNNNNWNSHNFNHHVNHHVWNNPMNVNNARHQQINLGICINNLSSRKHYVI